MAEAVDERKRAFLFFKQAQVLGIEISLLKAFVFSARHLCA